MKVRSLGLCGPAGAGSLPAPSGVREGIQSAATLSQDHHAGKTRRMGARRSGYLKRSRAAVSVQQTSPSEKNTGGRRVMQEVKRCCTRTQTCVVSEPPVTHLPAEQGIPRSRWERLEAEAVHRIVISSDELHAPNLKVNCVRSNRSDLLLIYHIRIQELQGPCEPVSRWGSLPRERVHILPYDCAFCDCTPWVVGSSLVHIPLPPGRTVHLSESTSSTLSNSSRSKKEKAYPNVSIVP